MRKLLLVIVITFAGFPLMAQTKLDSLYTIWEDEHQSDSTRARAITDYISKGFLYSKPDTAIILSQELLRFGEAQPYPKAKAMAYILIGVANYIQSDYLKALDSYQRSLKIYEETGDKKGMASSLNNIGLIYYNQANYLQSLDYFQRSLKIDEEAGNKERTAKTLNNIGRIYQNQGDYPQSLDYYRRSLKIDEEAGDQEGIAASLNNIGTIYVIQGEYPQALDYFQRVLKIFEEKGDKKGIGYALGNIGAIYQNQSDYPRALNYYQHSLKIAEEIGDIRFTAHVLPSLGTISQKQGAYPQALSFCNRGLRLSAETGLLEEEKEACQCLYDTYKAMGKSNEALEFLEKINVINDSLHAEETTKKLQQMEFAKAMLQDSIAKAEEARLIQEAHEEEMRAEEKTRNIGFGIGGLVLILAGSLYSRLRYVRKSKAVLQVEKDRSENLLLNILPEEIATELKEKGKADARDFEMVSILFTDFKGFTEQSAKLSAADLVNEINHCFEAFDGIMEKYGIEKIKTIGDAYMAAGGLPIPTDDSVKNTVLAALEMQVFINKRKTENDTAGKPAFEMRVGIHTGPVVAGIVGVKKFQYDIWGDTVNTASRMESNGEVGKVNISQSTYELLKEKPQFHFESRGKIVAKGKGEMEMYFVSNA